MNEDAWITVKVPRGHQEDVKKDNHDRNHRRNLHVHWNDNKHGNTNRNKHGSKNTRTSALRDNDDHNSTRSSAHGSRSQQRLHQNQNQHSHQNRTRRSGYKTNTGNHDQLSQPQSQSQPPRSLLQRKAASFSQNAKIGQRGSVSAPSWPHPSSSSNGDTGTMSMAKPSPQSMDAMPPMSGNYDNADANSNIHTQVQVQGYARAQNSFPPLQPFTEIPRQHGNHQHSYQYSHSRSHAATSTQNGHQDMDSTHNNVGAMPSRDVSAFPPLSNFNWAPTSKSSPSQSQSQSLPTSKYNNPAARNNGIDGRQSQSQPHLLYDAK